MPLLRPGPYYAVEIWKRSFICTVRPTVHTDPTLRRSSSNRRNFKTSVSRFSVDGKQFESGAFRKRWRHDNHVILLPKFSLGFPWKTNPKWPVIVATLKLLRRSVYRKPFTNFSVVVLLWPKTKHFNQSCAYPRFIIYYSSNNATKLFFVQVSAIFLWRFSFFLWSINIKSV